MMTEWSTGQPPCVGWWNASTNRDANCRRYWHGAYWSAPVFVTDPDSHAARAKAMSGESQFGVEWRGLTEPRSE